MKKYLMTGIAAIAMCAAFTSCSHDTGFEQMTQEEAIQSKYEAAFIKAFGQPAPNQDWGFGSSSTTTRTAYTNSNMWESDGLSVPAAITDREREVVMEWFRTHENPQSETVDLHNYFIQNVGYTDHTYHAYYQKDGRTETVTITNPSTSNMDYIFVGPGYYLNDWEGMTEPARITWDDGDDHTNNFNANSGEIQYMKYSGSEWFGFHDSYGNGSSTEGHGNNGKYCAKNRNFVIRYIDVDGVIGCYVGLNYESGKTSEGWHLNPDGFFDDRVLKLVPGEGTIGYQGRIMAEDLNAGEKSDFDFNDVVFDWKIDGNVATIQLRAAGGTLPLTVGGVEVHDKFRVSPNTMVNTGVSTAPEPAPYTYTFPEGVAAIAQNIPIIVTKGGVDVPLTAEEGKVASKINVPTNTKWVIEYEDITKAYPDFEGWVKNPNATWTSNFNSAYLY